MVPNESEKHLHSRENLNPNEKTLGKQIDRTGVNLNILHDVGPRVILSTIYVPWTLPWVFPKHRVRNSLWAPLAVTQSHLSLQRKTKTKSKFTLLIRERYLLKINHPKGPYKEFIKPFLTIYLKHYRNTKSEKNICLYVNSQ